MKRNKLVMDKNIMIIASLAYSLPHFRGDYIVALLNKGYTVYAAAPDMSSDVFKSLEKLGAKPVTIELDRTGLNPVKDLKTIFLIKKYIKQYKIDLVFPYTIKPVVYGSIAANITKTPTISLITGLGFTFSEASFKANFLQQITKRMYKYSLRKNRIVIFQNQDDLNLFKAKKILSKHQKTAIVNGSGVNFEKYVFRTKRVTTDNVKFVIVARLIKEKGIQLFLDAAKQLKKTFPKAEFHIIGEQSNTPSGIKLDELKQLHNNKVIIFHGSKNNVPEILSNMDVFVLPTYYREGIPRSILEALSTGMPIVTTDTPGCKETVILEKNGFLIPPNSLEPLITVCRNFLENPSIIEDMGLESRKLAEEKFNVNIINNYLINHVDTVLNN